MRGVIQDLSLLIGFAGVKQVPCFGVCVCVCVCVCPIGFAGVKQVLCVGLPEDCKGEIQDKVCGVWRRGVVGLSLPVSPSTSLFPSPSLPGRARRPLRSLRLL